MVVEVFLYMFFVGSGLALGAACVAFVAWKVYKRSVKKSAPNKKNQRVAF